jgi:hypothetical protein
VTLHAGQKVRVGNLGQLSTTAQYQASSSQTIGTAGTPAVVAFGTADTTSDLVTRSTEGAGHKFTLNASGIWSVTATVSFAANATGERRLNLEDSLGLWHCSVLDHGDASHPAILHVSITKFLTSGDYVKAEVYQTSGGNLNLDANALTALGRINLACIIADT